MATANVLPELLIPEIEKHEAIWHYKCSHYTDKEARQWAWNQIAANVIPEFRLMSAPEQNKEIKDLQLKWKSLRDCFQREIRFKQQNKDKPDVLRKKRPYIYFKILKFLMINYDLKEFEDPKDIEYIENYENNGQQVNIKCETMTDYSEEIIKNGEESRTLGDPIQSESTNTNNKNTISKGQKRTMDTFEENLLQLLQKRGKNSPITDDDGDKMFLLSQVPFFRKMPEKVKLWARLEITKIVQKAMEHTYESLPSVTYNSTSPIH